MNRDGDMTGQGSCGGSHAGCGGSESRFSESFHNNNGNDNGDSSNSNNNSNNPNNCLTTTNPPPICTVSSFGSGCGLAVFSWGRGEDGQLGLGDTSDQAEPQFLDALRGVSVKQLACGSGHTCVLTQDGEIYTWGRGDDGRLGHGDNGWKYVPRLVNALLGQVVTLVTCGSYHTAAVTNNGALFTWGGGMYGKLGHGNESGCTIPRKVEKLSGVQGGVKYVACGSRHTVAVTTEGALYSWGDQDNGVAGHEKTEGHQYIPKLVEKLRDKVVIGLSACGFHTGCITQEKLVYIWGEGKFGRLGLGNERNCHSPRIVEHLRGTNPKQISCGGFHSAVITEDGKLYTFGGGEHGQLGVGDKFNRLVPTLVQALEDSFVEQIACGWSHTVVLTEDGISSFGNAEHGKLGHGTVRKLSTPHLIETLKGHKIVSIASYNEHTAALVEPVHDSCAVWGAFGSNTVAVTTSYVQQMRELVNNEDSFADVVFVVGGEGDGDCQECVHAHKAILAGRCEHFAAMFRSGMRESVEREIEIPNVSKTVFLLLMEYIYTDSVAIDVEHAVDLYILADLYGLERLRSICVTVVKRNLSTANAPRILQQAADEDCVILKDISMDFVIANFEKISKTDGIRVVSHELLLEILSNRP